MSSITSVSDVREPAAVGPGRSWIDVRASTSRPAASPVLPSVSVPAVACPGISPWAVMIAAPAALFESASAPLAAAMRSISAGRSRASAPGGEPDDHDERRGDDRASAASRPAPVAVPDRHGDVVGEEVAGVARVADRDAHDRV